MSVRRYDLPWVLRRGRKACAALLVAVTIAAASPVALAVDEFATPSAPSGIIKKPPVVSDPRVIARQCPNMIGQTLEAAKQLAAAQRLALGPVTYRSSDGAPGVIVEQDRVARAGKAIGSCGVVVAQAWTVAVPSLIGATLDGARAALGDAAYHRLLSLGRQPQQRESDAPPGTIVQQAPAAGTKVNTPTLVSVVLAVPRPGIVVPNVVGMMQPAAEQAVAQRVYRGWLDLSVAGGRDSREPPGTIVAQSPAAGSRITGPTELRVLLARQPAVIVPDLTGLTPGAGVQTLTSAHYRGLLRLRALGERPAPTGHPAGTLFAQEPPPGTPVSRLTIINAWVAAAPAPVRVPDLSTMMPPAAGRRLSAAEFRGLLGLGAQHPRPSTARAGTIVDQKPPPQTPVTTPTRIEIWVAQAAPAVVVPNLVDFRPDDAKAHLAAETFGGLLSLGDVREREADKPAGVIVAQTPVAGAKVSVATRIDVWVAASRLVAVPNLSTLTRDGALAALTKVGLTLGDARSKRSDGQAGSVVGQTPEAGRRVRVGTPVSIVLVAPPAFWKPWHLIAAAIVLLLLLAARTAWQRWKLRPSRVAYKAEEGASAVTLDAPEPAGGAISLRAVRGPHETYPVEDDDTRPRRRPWPKTT